MRKAKAPCIGICSTTSLGDSICRGCKRYSFEVINWNSYGEEEKLAVLRRVEKHCVQILQNKFIIFSTASLSAKLMELRIPFDESLSPYCWLHTLIKKHYQKLKYLRDFGVRVQVDFRHLEPAELAEMIDKELLILSEAHYSRYLQVGYETA